MRPFAPGVVKMQHHPAGHLLLNTKVPLRVVGLRILIEQAGDATASTHLHTCRWTGGERDAVRQWVVDQRRRALAEGICLLRVLRETESTRDINALSRRQIEYVVTASHHRSLMRIP